MIWVKMSFQFDDMVDKVTVSASVLNHFEIANMFSLCLKLYKKTNCLIQFGFELRQEKERRAEEFLEARPHNKHRGSGAQLGRDRENGPGSETLENCCWRPMY